MLKLRFSRGITMFGMGLMALAVSACGPDTNSLAAQEEKALIALDEGRYADAVTILSALCPDLATCSPDLLALLAQAHMGVSGLVITDLLADLEAISAPGADPTAIFDVVDLLLLGGSAASAATLQTALDTYAAIAEPTANDQLLQGVAAAGHLVASIQEATQPGGAGVNAALAATVTSDLGVLLASAAAVDLALGVTPGTSSGLTDQLRQLQLDLEGASPDGAVSELELNAFAALI